LKNPRFLYLRLICDDSLLPYYIFLDYPLPKVDAAEILARLSEANIKDIDTVSTFVMTSSVSSDNEKSLSFFDNVKGLYLKSALKNEFLTKALI